MSAENIIRALPEYIDAVFELESECYHDPFLKNTLLTYLNNKNAVFYCALDDNGELLGHIIGHIAADECEVYTVAVKSAYRGRGTGYELVKKLILTAYESGVKSIFLEVRRSNYIAADLYEKAGFVKTGERKAYYEKPAEDALIYTLKL